LHRKEITDAEKAGKADVVRSKLVAEYKEKFANPYKAAELGYIDEVIDPKFTRLRLIQSLELLAGKRTATPARKHGNIPL